MTAVLAGRRVARHEDGHHEDGHRTAAALAQWAAALDDLEEAVERAAALAATPVTDGDVPDPPVAEPLAAWSPPLLDDRVLRTPQAADLVARMRRLRSRQLAVTSLLMAAMATNRRHREVLERAERPHDRALFIDESA